VEDLQGENEVPNQLGISFTAKRTATGSLDVFEGSGDMVTSSSTFRRVGAEGRCLWCLG
jgi:hypothetical protein